MISGPDSEGQLPIQEMDFEGLRSVAESLLPEEYHDRLSSLRNIYHQLVNLEYRLGDDGVTEADPRIQTIDLVASRIHQLDPELISRKDEKAYIQELGNEPDEENKKSAFARFRESQQRGEIPE